jgi:glycosyltransferase involved in cell wall biosynthesis
VHASWSEALSNFLIEAQAHGLPFVAYEAQGIGECGLPGRTAWPIARGDRDAFRAAIRHWLNESPATRAAAAAAARRFARETFDPARQVAAYLDLFARLVGR